MGEIVVNTIDKILFTLVCWQFDFIYTVTITFALTDVLELLVSGWSRCYSEGILTLAVRSSPLRGRFEDEILDGGQASIRRCPGTQSPSLLLFFYSNNYPSEIFHRFQFSSQFPALVKNLNFLFELQYFPYKVVRLL